MAMEHFTEHARHNSNGDTIHRNTNRSRHTNNNSRVILLLDLDCFYAQATCLRLGFDASTTALALLQWNSVLAVTYPARTRYAIQRGDSWEGVWTKSNGQCHCVHVPILCHNQQPHHQSATATTNTNNDTLGGTSDPQQQQQSSSITTSSNDDNKSIGISLADESVDNDDENDHTGKEVEAIAPVASLTDEYQRLFRLSDAEQVAARHAEVGVRKTSNQGKASIECYRIASAMIFDTVRTVLTYMEDKEASKQAKNTHGRVERGGGIVLERASIDEFFLDVTAAVDAWMDTQDDKNDINNDDDDGSEDNRSRSENIDDDNDIALGGLVVDAMKHTIVIGSSTNNESIASRHNSEDLDHAHHHCSSKETRRLNHGCAIAYRIRQAVADQLGFTMSAGIGTNKTLAKLAVTYGKPAGQAVCRSWAVEWLLNDTAIKSCRNLGGKLGSAVQKLLPPNVPATVGSIARYLSLSDLQHGLSSDGATAQRVFDIARGLDREPVESKTESSAVLTKSITAFKSLNFPPPLTDRYPRTQRKDPGIVVGHTLVEAEPWIELLAREVVTRVERDASRNDRYPRSCTIQYAQASATTNNSNKSIRISFPVSRQTIGERIAQLVKAVPKAIRSKLGHRSMEDFLLQRVGLCATDFESTGNVSNNAINKYFSTTAFNSQNTDVKISNVAKRKIGEVGVDPSAELGLVIHTVAVDHATANTSLTNAEHVARNTLDYDLEVAKRLQATYDRELQVLEVLDKSSQAKHTARKGPTHNPTKRRIDSFFQKKS